MVSNWTVGTVTEVHSETPTGRSIWLDVPAWAGSLGGQHVDVRLTAPDGYQATRSYSLASVGSDARVQLAVDRVPGGEVSPYLVDDLQVGDQVELRGPLGGWFVWKPEQVAPVQLVGGGSGIVPLVSMIRAHVGSPVPFKLLYSVRTPRDRFFAEELETLAGPDLDITFVYTREIPPDWPRPAGRLTRDIVEQSTIPASQSPAVFVCGPTGFVESVADWFVDLGHQPGAVKTERFGGK